MLVLLVVKTIQQVRGNSAFSKIFNTKSNEIIDNNCRIIFNRQLVSDCVASRKTKILLS